MRHHDPICWQEGASLARRLQSEFVGGPSADTDAAIRRMLIVDAPSLTDVGQPFQRNWLKIAAVALFSVLALPLYFLGRHYASPYCLPFTAQENGFRAGALSLQSDQALHLNAGGHQLTLVGPGSYALDSSLLDPNCVTAVRAYRGRILVRDIEKDRDHLRPMVPWLTGRLVYQLVGTAASLEINETTEKLLVQSGQFRVYGKGLLFPEKRAPQSDDYLVSGGQSLVLASNEASPAVHPLTPEEIRSLRNQLGDGEHEANTLREGESVEVLLNTGERLRGNLRYEGGAIILVDDTGHEHRLRWSDIAEIQ